MDVDDNTPIASITLERYRLQELPAEIAAGIERRLGRDPELRRRLDALARVDERQIERIAAGLRDRLAAGSIAPPTYRWRSLAPIAVTAAAIILMILPLVSSPGERIKGLPPSLALFRQVAAGSETLADGAIAHAGDVIRVGYRAAGQQYGVIVSIDGRGHVTVHMPAGSTEAEPLRREDPALLNQAFELDDAPRWERFYFVTGSEPFKVAPIVASAQRAVSLSRGETPPALVLDAGLSQTVFSLRKESHP